MVYLRCAAAIAVFAATPIATGIAQQEAGIAIARRQIQNLRVDSAIAELHAVLENPGQLSPSQLGRSYVLLGIAEVMLGQDSAATAAFHEALWINPETEIDSLADLSSGLNETFSRERSRWSSVLRVTSEPTAAQILVDSRYIGLTPLERPVPGGSIVRIVAKGPSWGEQGTSLIVPAQRRLSIHFSIPEDTSPVPIGPTVDQLRSGIMVASATEWRPSTSPPEPVTSATMRYVGSWVGGTIGFVGGFYLAASLICSGAC